MAMLLVPTGAALVGALLPYTGLAHLLGFSVLPTTFFVLLFAMVVVYLLLVEGAKSWFFRRRTPHLAVRASTHAQRLERRILKRASRFISHEGPTLR
jgi:Mg2+-importing ATPase